MICLRVIRSIAAETWNKKPLFNVNLSYMTDVVLATNRRGQIIMVNEMAAATGMSIQMRCSIPVFGLVYQTTKICEAWLQKYQSWPSIQDAKINSISLQCALCLDVASQVLSLVCSCFARYDRVVTRKKGNVASLVPMESWMHGTFDQAELSGSFDDGAVRASSTRFLSYFTYRNQLHDAHVRSIELRHDR